MAYYIPPSILAMRLGGSHHAAFVTNLFDIGGYILGAWFSYYTTNSGNRGEWSGVLLLLTLCNGIGLISMALAMRSEEIRFGILTSLLIEERSRSLPSVKLLKY